MYGKLKKQRVASKEGQPEDKWWEVRLLAEKVEGRYTVKKPC
jgi:hypothetical protein